MCWTLLDDRQEHLNAMGIPMYARFSSTMPWPIIDASKYSSTSLKSMAGNVTLLFVLRLKLSQIDTEIDAELNNDKMC